jgi:hypothetical protein
LDGGEFTKKFTKHMLRTLNPIVKMSVFDLSKTNHTDLAIQVDDRENYYLDEDEMDNRRESVSRSDSPEYKHIAEGCPFAGNVIAWMCKEYGIALRPS